MSVTAGRVITSVYRPGRAAVLTARRDARCRPGSRTPSNTLTIYAAVQLAAATILLREGVGAGEQLGHRAIRSPDPPAAGATAGSSGRGRSGPGALSLPDSSFGLRLLNGEDDVDTLALSGASEEQCAPQLSGNVRRHQETALPQTARLHILNAQPDLAS